MINSHWVLFMYLSWHSFSVGLRHMILGSVHIAQIPNFYSVDDVLFWSVLCESFEKDLTMKKICCDCFVVLDVHKLNLNFCYGVQFSFLFLLNCISINKDVTVLVPKAPSHEFGFGQCKSTLILRTWDEFQFVVFVNGSLVEYKYLSEYRQIEPKVIWRQKQINEPQGI